MTKACIPHWQGGVKEVERWSYTGSAVIVSFVTEAWVTKLALFADVNRIFFLVLEHEDTTLWNDSLYDKLKINIVCECMMQCSCVMFQTEIILSSTTKVRDCVSKWGYNDFCFMRMNFWMFSCFIFLRGNLVWSMKLTWFHLIVVNKVYIVQLNQLPKVFVLSGATVIIASMLSDEISRVWCSSCSGAMIHS